MSYTAALTPGEGGWICAETAEAPEAISQGRMLEEAKANVGEALGERAQVTVTPVAVAGSRPLGHVRRKAPSMIWWSASSDSRSPTSSSRSKRRTARAG